mmetsp:Transcript_19254/g.27080  ORF Transcript_19254/g.27080 Transcript_19254/m.27080 type:complete len:96 (+) Transcript_19254:61-348(+)
MIHPCDKILNLIEFYSSIKILFHEFSCFKNIMHVGKYRKSANHFYMLIHILIFLGLQQLNKQLHHNHSNNLFPKHLEMLYCMFVLILQGSDQVST